MSLWVTCDSCRKEEAFTTCDRCMALLCDSCVVRRWAKSASRRVRDRRGYEGAVEMAPFLYFCRRCDSVRKKGRCRELVTEEDLSKWRDGPRWGLPDG